MALESEGDMYELAKENISKKSMMKSKKKIAPQVKKVPPPPPPPPPPPQLLQVEAESNINYDSDEDIISLASELEYPKQTFSSKKRLLPQTKQKKSNAEPARIVPPKITADMLSKVKLKAPPGEKIDKDTLGCPYVTDSGIKWCVQQYPYLKTPLKDLPVYKIVVLKDKNCHHSFYEIVTKKPLTERYLNIYKDYRVDPQDPYVYNIYEVEIGMYPECIFVIADLSDTGGKTSASMTREVVSNLAVWSEKFGAEQTAPLADLYMDFTFPHQQNLVKALNLIESIHQIQKNKDSPYKCVWDVDMDHFWDGKFVDQLYSGRKYRVPVLPDELLPSVLSECGCKEYAPLCKTCGMCSTCVNTIGKAVSTVQPSFRMMRDTNIDKLNVTGSIISYGGNNLEYIFRSDMSYEAFSHIKIVLLRGINYKIELTNME
ncbi:unnamed protein product [Mytilus edulis]|uniref:Uncharacterized protein n=1 Tax=Mytilus edulis TaxID=6550 RepID=A0A8S3TK07_MYTED|nr:unnamed protein product [Mytilus edulis]